MTDNHLRTRLALDSLEKAHGLPEGFLLSLLVDGDDWSFVIKAHAVVEAAVAYMLTAALRKPSLSDTLARLELSNTTTGKLAFVAQLDLLSAPVRRFIKKFSELRNDLVHKVRNVEFTFQAWEASLDAQQKRAYQEAFTGAMTPVDGGPLPAFHQMALKRPRSAIWLSVLLVVVLAELEQATAEIADQRDRLREDRLKQLEEISTAAESLLGPTGS